MKLFLTRPAKVRLVVSLAICLSVVGFAFLYAQTRRGSKEGAKPVADQPTLEQARGDSASKKVRTELVRRLLEKLDSLDDISAEDKKELERILLEADAELAQAPAKPRVTGLGPRSGDRPAKAKPPQAGQEASTKQAQASEGQGQPETPTEAETPMVRALLKLLDEVIEDNLADNSEDTQSADALRESLLRSDQVLRQYLGQAARARIEAANRKPPVPQVSNPRKKPSSDAEQK